MKLLENCSLLPYNAFGLDVLTRYLVEYQTDEELLGFLNSGFLDDKAFYSVGGGSNILFTQPYEGVLLHSKIKGIEVLEDNEDDLLVKVGAGEEWDDFVAYCVENNWCGAENLSNIPGHVGASPVQNIGAYGVEVQDIIEKVIGVDLPSKTVKELSNEACCFGYRQSIFKNALKDKFIVTAVVYRLSKTNHFKLEYGDIKTELDNFDGINLRNIRQAIITIRTSKLPDIKVLGNAGSFFKNPVVPKVKLEALQKDYASIPFYNTAFEDEVKIPAAWLIEQAGWKGKSHGDAAVHDKQALVIVNKGNATGEEIVELSSLICESVLAKFGVVIEPEVIFL